jgi:isoquinoline 1-oxidoreductase beta subunit
LWSKASWTSWRTRRSSIPSLIAKRCSAIIRERSLFCRLLQKKQGGDHHFPHGMAAGFRYNSHSECYMSQVAEVEVAADGSVKVKRIVCAVDCGMYVNPDTIEAQVQGGTLFGLTAALHGSITFKDGRVEQSNFDSYLPMRIDEVPVVETHLIKNAEAPGGIGEAPTSIVSAAVTNAIFAATGKRLRNLPFDTDSLKSSP